MSVTIQGSGQAIVQVKQAVKTDTATTTSTTFVDVTGLSVTITPSSSTSKFLVQFNIGAAVDNPNTVKFNLVRNGTAIAQPDSGTNKATVIVYGGGTNAAIATSMLYLDSPATTSPVTYKVQWCVDGSTGYLNRHVSGTDYNSISSITVMEISGS